MRSAEEHAARHGLELTTSGPCPMCAGPTGTGYQGCLDDAGRLADLINFGDEANHITRFLSVDTMALQHSEVHGPWNNYLHLARIQLIMVDGLRWRYPFTPLLSAATDAYARLRSPSLPPPPPGRRGHLTAHDLAGITDGAAAARFVQHWARSVSDAFDPAAAATVRPIADDFLRRLDGHRTRGS